MLQMLLHQKIFTFALENIGQTMSSCFDGAVACHNKWLLPGINVIFVETSQPFNLFGRHVKSCEFAKLRALVTIPLTINRRSLIPSLKERCFEGVDLQTTTLVF